MKKLLTLLLAVLALSIDAAAEYMANSVAGDVFLLGNGIDVRVKRGMILEPSDRLQIAEGASIVILDDSDSRLYTIDTAGTGEVSDLLRKVRAKAGSTTAAVNRKLRFKRERRQEDVIYQEKGKVTRAPGNGNKSAYTDADRLAARIVSFLRDSIDTLQDAPEFIYASPTDTGGLSLSVMNATGAPTYYNILKISGDGEVLTTSEFGKADGCISLQPDDISGGVYSRGIVGDDLHIIVISNFPFDINDIITRIESIAVGNADMATPSDACIYILDKYTL